MPSCRFAILVAVAVTLVAGCATPPRPVDYPGVRAHIEQETREKKNTFDAPAEAMEFYVRQRAPFGQPLPVEKYLDAQQHIRAVLAQRAADGAAIGRGALPHTRDEPRGGATGQPGGIRGWRGIGPGDIGGRTRALAIHPLDHEIMYAGGVSGGVWKTTDGGQSWTALDDFLPNLAVASIAIDPIDPDVLYVGTGEGYYPVSSPTVEAIFLRGLGIFKSIDGGATWTTRISTT
jgi:hypothetical protein